MPIPGNVLANADDFGLNTSVNKAILYCYENGYINSASVLTNTASFNEGVELIHHNACIVNLGVHINIAEGRPLTNVATKYLNTDGNWNLDITGKKLNIFNKQDEQVFLKEIHAQVGLALANKIPLTHIDSHYHLHTLPGFYKIFTGVARHFKLKLRLAQTYREGSYLKYLYRKYINGQIIGSGHNYSVYFETVAQFMKYNNNHRGRVEVMLHPDFDQEGNLTDHFDRDTMINWINYLNNAVN